MFLNAPITNQKLTKWKGMGKPSVILAEGDSWFDYPVFPSNGGSPLPHFDLLWQLHDMGRVFTSVAHAGDCVSQMVSNRQLDLTARAIDNLNYNKVKISCVLISGGGNDMSSTNMNKYLRKNENGQQADDFVIPDKFEAVFQEIKANYITFIDKMRELIRADVKVLGHTYDYAVPNGKGYKILGMIDYGDIWISSHLKDYDVPPNLYEAMIEKLINRFAECLAAVKAERPSNFDFADLRGTISRDQWVNELHPNDDGFECLAIKFNSFLLSHKI